MIINYNVAKPNNINNILKNELHISNRLLVKLINNKKILLNNNVVDTRLNAKKNDMISILLDTIEENDNIVPTKMDLNIIYEDEALLIVNKPAGIATHPSMAHFDDSLSNGIKYYFDKINLAKKIRPVNRLDYNTSGLVIFAKNEYIQEILISQMKNNTFKKEYLAIVNGIFENKIGSIDLPIARKENSIIERCIDKKGQNSITHYEVLKEFKDYSLVKCILETGRTHQIRVHMAYIRHPLLGDTLYGTTSSLINRQALHCYKLKFVNPINNIKQEFISPLPKDFQYLIYKS